MHVFINRLLFLLGVVLVLLLASFTYHRLALQRENASLNPVGAKMVAVNGYKISVFVKGSGVTNPSFSLWCWNGFTNPRF